MADNIFQKLDTTFRWNNIPFTLRMHYNYLLNRVAAYDLAAPSPYSTLPAFYNKETCLALVKEPVMQDFAKPKSMSDAIQPFSGCDKYDTDNLAGALFCFPFFKYERKENAKPKKELNITTEMKLEGLSAGAAIWLYYYERMGIFKILGALMDDYNYRRKYPISYSVNSDGTYQNAYAEIMESVCLLYRMGVGSQLRDRLHLYVGFLGQSLPGTGIEVLCEPNDGLFRTTNKFLAHATEFYRAKQVAQAIQNANGANVRSSVATQTSIVDTAKVFQQHLEPAEYGRNSINTFLGIATVYVTICLLRLIKEEIGIPRQYNEPHELIPAAYDRLVMQQSVTSSETNRFTIYDNCATYGDRLFTDLQFLNLNAVPAAPLNSKLDAWLDDIEAWVEGYRNATASIPDAVATN